MDCFVSSFVFVVGLTVKLLVTVTIYILVSHHERPVSAMFLVPSLCQVSFYRHGWFNSLDRLSWTLSDVMK